MNTTPNPIRVNTGEQQIVSGTIRLLFFWNKRIYWENIWSARIRTWN